MTGAKGKRKVTVKNVSAMKNYMRVTLFLSVALIALIFAQYNIAQKQKNMLIITYMTERQMGLQNNILTAARAYQKTENADLLRNIRNDATESQNLDAQVFPLMMQSAWFAMPQVNLALFEKFRNVAIQGISYAAYAEAHQKGNAADILRDIVKLHEEGALTDWHAEVRKYIEAVQKEVDALVYGTYALYLTLLGFLLFQAMTQVLPLMKETDALRGQIKDMAATDMLTGIYNRAMLFKLGHMLISASQRHKQELTMLAVDVDNFEAINNKHGRAVADHMLHLLADELATCLRTSDVLGRFGGDEFGIFLPATDEYRAVYVAEKLRAAAEALAYTYNDTQVMLTVSIGVAEIQKTHTAPDDILRAAQEAMQKAKSKGRNCCVAYSEMDKVPVAAV